MDASNSDRGLCDPSVFDPKGLLREAYRIDGITEPECRTIFLDWAIQVPVGVAAKDHIEAALAHYATGQDNHPMTVTLQAGLRASPTAKRRGGRAARVGQNG